MVWFCTFSGTPQIVPFSPPKSKPSGRPGEMSQLSGVEPEVCPAMGCMDTPSVSIRSLVGKLRKIPFPTIQRVTSVLVVPPELLAVTV